MHRASVLLTLLAVAGIAAAQDFLLVPESSGDNIGKFDPVTGAYLGVFAHVPQVYGTSATPISAVLGPDGNVYCSDQVQDAVFKFDINGNYLGVFCDASDGLDNVRGITWYGNELFVSHAKTGAKAVLRFDINGNLLGNFITGVDPFDVHFLPDGRSLVADIEGSTDSIRLYDASGSPLGPVVTITNGFPEQINDDSELPGTHLAAWFSANKLMDFDLDGTIQNQVTLSGARGIWRLGNGNYLATDGNGVHEIDPLTGVIIQTEQSGVSARFIEFVPEPAGLLLMTVMIALRRR